ncbi:hypothetical protein Pfo_019386 [Paulownia fortunei]|nr:hypothetical protein Pfo_019386 [Paulownia fortunei]
MAFFAAEVARRDLDSTTPGFMQTISIIKKTDNTKLEPFMEMKTIDFLILFLMLSSVCFATEARRLNASKDHGFSTDAVKAGPSPGEGHKFVNADTLGGIKESGPSPGEGHKFPNAKTLGGIKESGPSPGEGHKFPNAKTLGGIKESGPSPGEGHKFPNAKTLGGIKESGPSPGAGH